MAAKLRPFSSGPPSKQKKAGITHITICGRSIPLSSRATNLGVTLDSCLSFDTHIKSVGQTSFYHLKNISKVRPSLRKPEKSPPALTSVTLCLLASHPKPSKDFNMSKTAPLGSSQKHTSQSTSPGSSAPSTGSQQTSASPTNTPLQPTSKSPSPLTPDTPIWQRYTGPNWPVWGPSPLLTGPRLWNQLPGLLRALDSLEVFKSNLKSHFFLLAFPWGQP